MNARQIGGTLTPPSVYGFQLGVERRDPNGLVAILGALFQSCQEFARRLAAVRGLGEEEIVFRVPEGQHALDDDAASRRDAVDDPGIPPVEFRSQMVEEDNRHSGVGPELPVDAFRSADIDAFRRRIAPRDLRSRMRLWVPAHIALQEYRGPTPTPAARTRTSSSPEPGSGRGSSIIAIRAL